MDHAVLSTSQSTSSGRARRVLVTLLTVLGLVVAGTAAHADGTETLGPPSISIASGSGIVAAGTGMVSQPGSIDLEVPAGATVNQVLLYWGGMSQSGPGDATIVVGGTEVTGTLIGGPAYFFGTGTNTHVSSAYRADITALGLVSAGTNTVSVSGLAFDQVDNGAGILAIYDDGSDAEIGMRDGLDLAFFDFPAPRDTTVAQTFAFAPEDTDRVADLAMFFNSVEGQDLAGQRPTVIEVTVDGVVTQHVNMLTSADGDEWDTVSVEVAIPAGVSEVTVQALSADVDGTGNRPASFAWTMASLAVPVTPPPPPPPPPAGGEGCTPGFWKQPHHLDSWVDHLPNDGFEAVFGVDASFDLTLLGALRQGGGGEKALGRHAVAALLNSASADVDFAHTSAEVIALVQEAYATGDFQRVKNLLEDENERGCPLS